ncbi:MAG: FapA family protein [bacterium]|nr:FapA family protein [bacterium]
MEETRGIEAVIRLTAPKRGGKPPTLKSVLSALEAQGITYGIDEPAIISAIKKSRYNLPIRVARAKLPTKGEPARYSYRFGIREENQTQDLDRLEVIPGQILAVKSQLKQGNPGISVFGEEIPGLLGDDFPITPGKNTYLSENGRILYAVGYGEANWTENRCDVEKVLRIDGDLSEDLSFDGKVIVSGKILADIKVSVGDLYVKGDIEAGVNITASGSVETEGDILGEEGKKTTIDSKCNIIANSASYSSLKAEGSVLISTGLAHCETTADSVIAVGRKGIIMIKGTPPPSRFSLPIAMTKGVQGLFGGKASAKERIEAEIIGSISLEPTEVTCSAGGIISSTSCIYPKVKINIGGKQLDITKQLDSKSIKEERQSLGIYPYEEREVSLTSLEHKAILPAYPPSILIEDLSLAKAFLQELGVGEIDFLPINVEQRAVYLCFGQGQNGPWNEIKARLAEEKQKEEERPGLLFIDNAEEGLFITIAPPGERGKPLEEQELKERLSPFFEIDRSLLVKAISQQRGVPTKVAERQYIPEIDGKLELEIREAEGIPNLESYLTITLPKRGAKPIPPRIVGHLLKKKGITFGLLIKRIKALLKSSIRNKPILIARGKPPTKGEPAKLIYQFGQREGVGPENRLEVIPGQVLAIKSQANLGDAGKDILSKEIPAILGDDLKIIPGKNTYLTNDDTVLYAVTHGEAIWTENRCDVERCLRIKGDLTEDIAFNGKLFISGSILEGVKVRTEGDLYVKGEIRKGADIMSKGKVETEGDILGEKGNEVIISSDYEIIANSASYSTLKAGGSALIRTGLSNCETTANSVIVVGRKGMIMTSKTPPPPVFSLPIAMTKGVQGLTGGKAYAKERIEAEIIGSISMEPTEVTCSAGGIISSTSCIYPKVKVVIGGKTLNVSKQIDSGSIKEERQSLKVCPYEEHEVSLTHPEYKAQPPAYPPSILTKDVESARGFLGSEKLKVKSEKLKVKSEKQGKEEEGAQRNTKEGERQEIDSIPINVEGKEFYLCFQEGKKGPWEAIKEKITEEKRIGEEKDGSFLIENLEEGLFITVTPSGSKGKRIEEAKVRESLKGFSMLNEKALLDAIFEQKSVPIKIAERQYIPEIDGRLELEIKEAEGIPYFEAWLTITTPKPRARPISPSVMASLLKEQEITYGLLIKRIKAWLKNPTYNKPILIVKAKPPTKGELARFIYQFGQREISGPEDRLEVIPGQILAIKELAKQGEDGIDIKGNPIPGLCGDDISMLAGRNCNLSSDNKILYSVSYGEAFWTAGKCNVEKLLKIEGDLTEDISFSGKVIVSGNVGERILISATRDIEIMGRVGNGSELNADGGISIDKGAFGKEDDEVILVAKGDIVANSLIHSRVKADGNVIVKESMTDTDVEANSIFVAGKKGIIMSKGIPPPPIFNLPIAIKKGEKIMGGGTIIAKVDIETEEIGNPEKVYTDVKVAEGGRVSVSGTVFPGTRITIGRKTLEVRKPLQATTFKLYEGMIVAANYEQCEVKPTEIEYPESKIAVEMPYSIVVARKTLADSLIDGAGFLKLGQNEVDFALVLDEKELKVLRVYPAKMFGPWSDGWREEYGEQKDGSFSFENRTEGLYLLVNPPYGGGRRIEYSEVETGIFKEKFIDINQEVIRIFFREVEEGKHRKQSAIKIGPRQYLSDVSSIIRIKRHSKSVEAVFYPPKVGGMLIDMEEIIRYLDEQGIKAGLKKQNLVEALSSGKFKEAIVVAEAVPPTAGIDARIEYKVKISEKKAPSINEDGRCDFKNILSLPAVKKGDVLAIKVEAIPGKPGQEITGEQIPAPLVKDIVLPCGKNTQVSEDGKSLIANIDGRVILSGEKVYIEPVYEVIGNVGPATGNIDFVGTVLITGSILDGFKVKAGEDILVRDAIDGGEIEAKGKVEVIKGIRKAQVKAGEVVANFVEGSNISAKKIKIIGDIILSEISGEEVSARKIRGGRVRCSLSIISDEAGSPAFIKTRLEVGISPEDKKEMEALINDITKEKDELVEISLGLKNAPQEKKIALSEKQERLSSSLKEKIEALKVFSARPIIQGAYISIKKKAYVGTEVVVGKAEHHLDEDKAGEFRLVNGKIEIV